LRNYLNKQIINLTNLNIINSQQLEALLHQEVMEQPAMQASAVDRVAPEGDPGRPAT
jgi:hypothetical protein